MDIDPSLYDLNKKTPIDNIPDEIKEEEKKEEINQSNMEDLLFDLISKSKLMPIFDLNYQGWLLNLIIIHLLLHLHLLHLLLPQPISQVFLINREKILKSFKIRSSCGSFF